MQGEGEGRGGYNSAGAVPWRRLTATTEPTNKGGLLKLLGCKMGPDSAKVQANLAPKELTVAKGQSPGAKGARAWLESKRNTPLKHDQATPTRKLRARLEAAATVPGEAFARLRNDFFSKSTREAEGLEDEART